MVSLIGTVRWRVSESGSSGRAISKIQLLLCSVFSEKQGSQPLLGNSWLLDDHAA
jgi:hypothetical protein